MDFNNDENTKIWEKPWSIDEIKNSAGVWSLAADSGVNVCLLNNILVIPKVHFSKSFSSI
jgi:hypothetical protein